MARPYRMRRWVSPPADPAACLTLAETLSLSPVTAQILYNRGLVDPEEARDFLVADRSRLHDPYLLAGLAQAVAPLRSRAAAGGPILVWGDYDVDGITGTALLVSVLQSLGATVRYHIPNRFTEGYGLNGPGLERWFRAGYDLVVTVDTGINALAEADLARSLGMTLIITDHHEPGPSLPGAAAVVNPKRADCPYPFTGLAGAGVAFKLAQALLDGAPAIWDYLDLVALATVADLVPLLGENRVLVKEGLVRLGDTRRPGLVALKAAAGIAPGPVSAGQIAYQLGPRLNALGRMGEAAVGVELLLTADAERARELTARVEAENRARQAVQETILQKALAQMEQQDPAERSHAVVLAGAGWHPGVVGICAAKVVEATYRPAFLLTIEGDLARGSARSIPGFHLHRALSACSDLLVQFGGHAMAAGLTLRAADIPRLRERLNDLARQWLRDEDLVPRLDLDAWVAPELLGLQLAEEVARLEPFGLGNPEPSLACAGLRVVTSRPVGKTGDHLKLRLQAGDQAHDAIGFGLARPGAPGAASLPPGSACQVAFRPEINVWNGQSRFQLVVTDLVPTADGAPVVTGAAVPVPAAGVAAAGPAAAATAATAATAAAAPGSACALQQWDPLRDLAAPTGAVPATDTDVGALPAFQRLDADWPACTAALAAAGPVAVLVSSPWVVPLARERVAQALGDGAAAVTVLSWGEPLPAASAVVALHPPYHLGQAAALAGRAAPVYAAWTAADWQRAAVLLGWPYPDRPHLVRIWKLLTAAARGSGQPVAALDLARRLAGGGLEPMGPWNLLRVRAAAAILAEIGLISSTEGDFLHILPASTDTHGKMNLNNSARYRKGLVGREALRRCQDALGS